MIVALASKTETAGSEHLPCLLYVGDVPVESSYHGSALLYRLFDGYDTERLLIIEAGLCDSMPGRRLQGVRYAFAPAACRRLSNTRLHRLHRAWLTVRSRATADRLVGCLSGFQPEAVVTVAHGFSWDAAAVVAARFGLPLHLIVHDDWPSATGLPSTLQGRAERRFEAVYRQAASRLCVSSFMVDEYSRRYGQDGTVLYPSMSSNERLYTAPPPRVENQIEGLTFAFAGTINLPDYVRLIRALAKSLEPVGGRVLIFGPLTSQQVEDAGLASVNIELRGLLPSGQLIEVLRAEADVLFVPMSFADRDRPNMEISFPSKLTDYSAVGLPVLIAGPPYCSAVRWARANPGVAEVADDGELAGLQSAVRRLGTPELRASLARQLLQVGSRLFSSTSAKRTFLRAVQGVEPCDRDGAGGRVRL